MKLDLEAKTLRVSVRELCAPRQRAPIGLGAAWRVRLGQRVHAAYEAEATASAERGVSVATEVPVTIVREVMGFTAIAHGRADVVRRAPDAVLVEEVKSVLSRPGEATLARALFQVQLYALGLHEEGAAPPSAHVVLVSLVDGSREVLDAAYTPSDARAALDDALGVLLEEALAGSERRARRAASADALRFPYREARAHQLELIEILERALEEGRPALAAAPTGIGKTVTTLLPALRFALRHDAAVFYLTAKTTQRKLVGETFEHIAKQAEGALHPLRALTLRSRAEMCPPGHLRCHPSLCPLLANFEQRAGETRAVEGLLERVHLDPDDIFERGSALSLCPYELSMRAAEVVDVVIGDYNHLFDERSAASGLLGVGARVVVLDEAHNLFDRARSYFSPFVGRRGVRAAREATYAAEPPALAAAIARWCDAVDEAVIDGARWRGEGERPDVDGCAPAALELPAWEALAAEGELLGARYAQERYLRASVTGHDAILELVAVVSQLADLGASGDAELVAYASEEVGEQGLGLGIVCVDPARRLERVHKKMLGTLAVSATLSPIGYYAEVLGLSRLNPVLTSAPSPFPAENRQVLICPEVSTTFRERDEHAPRIAQLIEATYRARRGRYIAFFSSFAFLNTVRQHLSLPPREVLVQLPVGGHAARTLLLKQLERSPSALLCAVMGGVFGEGIDLPGDALIGAIVVGPGLPRVSFERLAMQHYFGERHESGFAYAMVYPGIQRVIQAAGRVIRTMEDAGVVVLLGRRFAESDYLDCLPEHWYRHRPEELITDDLAGELARFWESL